VEKGRDGRAPRRLFDALSFRLAAGERLALLAPTAAVATSAARTLAWLARPASGTIRFEGQDLSRLGGREQRALRRRLQYVSGNARPALAPLVTVAGLLAEPLQVHRLGASAAQQAQIAAAAGAWGLNAALLEAQRGALSPAVCVRVALARASLLGPKLVVADRLTEFVEPAASGPLLAQLAGYCGANGTACVLVTTDEGAARALGGRVQVILG
jgi:ABC-type glutathione transport system ATPase component